jgi:acetylornithine deacetylase
VANEQAPAGVRFLVNGEPTDNRLGAATRGVLRLRLRASGRAAHSSFPELGDSAIDKLLDALMVIRGVQLPDDPLLGRTHYTVGLIEGGVAPNVVSPHASAELLFRTVGDGAAVRSRLDVVEGLVDIEHVLDIPAVRLHTVSGFETEVFPYTTDVPLLSRWGTPLLLGPGSIHVAHTDEEHVSMDELLEAVGLYESLALRLLASAA